MHRILFLWLCVVFVTGCGTKPVTKTEVHQPDSQSIAYHGFIARRTDELQQMGGPFKDRNVAATKATDEAKHLYGEVPAEYTTTWSWGKKARDTEAQAKINAEFEKMARNKAAP